MKLEALDHPKTLDLAARLDVELPTAIGYLELLWAFTGKKAPEGNIGKWPDGAIARACCFMGHPETFLAALVASGFVDSHPEHGYVIHDWHEHCPRWVSAKLKKLGAEFCGNGPTVVRSAVRTAVATTEASPRARAIPREDKGREGKRIRERAPVPTAEATAEGNREPTAGGGQQQSTATWSDAELMDAFAVVRSAYPPVIGDQSRWTLAERAWRDRLEEGEPPAALLAGVERYAAFVAAGGVSPAGVLGPQKFFDPNARRWQQPWDPPATRAETRLANNLTAAEEFMRRTESA